MANKKSNLKKGIMLLLVVVMVVGLNSYYVAPVMTEVTERFDTGTLEGAPSTTPKPTSKTPDKTTKKEVPTKTQKKASTTPPPTPPSEEQVRLGNEIMAKMNTNWKNTLFTFVDRALGDYSFGLPGAWCTGSFYDSSWGFNYNEGTDFFKTRVNDMFANVRTTVIEGEKTELLNDKYRYNFEIRLITERPGLKWELYLSNSCTETTLAIDEGSLLSTLDYFNKLYLETYTTETCPLENNEPCVFDYACVKYEDGDLKCNALVGDFTICKTTDNVLDCSTGKMTCQ